jgi:rhomboid protease GluP
LPIGIILMESLRLRELLTLNVSGFFSVAIFAGRLSPMSDSASLEKPSVLPGHWRIRATWLSAKPRPESGLVAAVATFLLAVLSLFYWSDLWHSQQWLTASRSSVFDSHQYWRAWTTLFAHGDVGHLVANSFLFFILAFFLYGYFGLRLFPVGAFFWGGVANLIVLRNMDANVELIGASGVVYLMGGTWLVLYYFLSRQKNRTERVLRTLGVAVLLFMPSQAFEAHISYQTHFVGFVLGLMLGMFHFLRHRERFQAAERREFEPDEDFADNENMEPTEELAKSPVEDDQSSI